MLIDLPPPAIELAPLPYESRLERRDVGSIDLIVIHCTELPDIVLAREYGERVLYSDSGTGNSGHFYIDRDGRIEQYVDPQYVANHTKGYNPRSIGIELVNVGRYPEWLDSRHQSMDESYTAQQIDALVKLLLDLQTRYPRLQFIAGHEDLDVTKVPASDNPEVLVSRKRDPGPQFPWDAVLRQIRLHRILASR